MTTSHLFILLGTLPFLALGCGPPERHSVQTQSEIFSMDKVYKSMFGPRDRDRLTLRKSNLPEVLWVTGIKADVVGSDHESPESAEYFCHSALTRLKSQPEERRRLLGPQPARLRKMFTLVQGLDEIRFPEGFGMPVLSNDQFDSSVMVMNPLEREETIRVGVNSQIEYVREADAQGAIQPLFLIPFVLRVPVTDSSEHASHVAADDESCLSHGGSDVSVTPVDRSQLGRAGNLTESSTGTQLTGHWYVPPGRHVYRHTVDDIGYLLQFDTRAHYIYAHLHPFGESLELIDLTTGESVFKSEASNFPDRIAVEKISHYSSQEGIPIFSDHEYEIVAVYNNTSGIDVDSMAVLYFYLLDKG